MSLEAETMCSVYCDMVITVFIQLQYCSRVQCIQDLAAHTYLLVYGSVRE